MVGSDHLCVVLVRTRGCGQNVVNSQGFTLFGRMIADPIVIFKSIVGIHTDGTTFVTAHELRCYVHSGRVCPSEGNSTWYLFYS